MYHFHSVYEQRIWRLQESARHAGIDAVLVGSGSDLQYFTGIGETTRERLMCLVVPSREGSEPILIIPHIEIKLYRQSPSHDCVHLVQWKDGEDPCALIGKILPSHYRLAVSRFMSAMHLVPLDGFFTQPFVLADAVIDPIRMRKDPEEVRALCEAGESIDRVHENLRNFLVPGVTESEVAQQIKKEIIKQGHKSVDFVIVASGPHGADPHHEYSEKVLSKGDIIVVDIGGVMPSGYCSDCTRMYSLDEPDCNAHQMISHLEEAQKLAVDAITPGVLACEVDSIARNSLAQHNLDHYFTHRLGHGIGLSVHEAPDISVSNQSPLEPGYAFSIEPGIYLPGKWGARIEDIVIVGEEKAISVNNTPRSLHIIT